MNLYEFHMARAYRCNAASFKCQADAVKHDTDPTLSKERRAEMVAHFEAMAASYLDMADIAESEAQREAA